MGIKDIARDVLDKSFCLYPKGVFIALSGDLGSGKTTLAKCIAKNIGIEENVISPTFVIQKSYKPKNSKIEEFIHIDLYRVTKKVEQKNIGLFMPKKETITIIEWFEYLKIDYPSPDFWIDCIIDKDQKHLFKYRK